jgi:hypothetical protein
LRRLKLSKERTECKKITEKAKTARKGRNGRKSLRRLKLSKERTEWKKITEKAKTHSGL